MQAVAAPSPFASPLIHHLGENMSSEVSSYPPSKPINNENVPSSYDAYGFSHRAPPLKPSSSANHDELESPSGSPPVQDVVESTREQQGSITELNQEHDQNEEEEVDQLGESASHRFPAYDLSSAPHPDRDVPLELRQPRSKSFSNSEPGIHEGRSDGDEHARDRDRAASASPRPSSRRGDGGVGAFPSLSGQSEPHGITSEPSHHRHFSEDHADSQHELPHLRNGSYPSHTHPHAHLQPAHPNVVYGTPHQPYTGSQSPSMGIYPSALNYATYGHVVPHGLSHGTTGANAHHFETAHDPRLGTMLPRLPAPARQTNGQGLFLPSHPGMPARSHSSHAALGGNVHPYEQHGSHSPPFPMPAYPPRSATASSVGSEALDPSATQYHGVPQQYQPHYPHEYAMEQQHHHSPHSYPGHAGPASYYNEAGHPHSAAQHHHQHYQQHQQQLELRYHGSREAIDHGSQQDDDEYNSHQHYDHSGQDHFEQHDPRGGKKMTRRSAPRRSAASRATSSNIYHPTPQSMLAPNAPSLPWSGIPGVPSDTPPGRLAGIPTDDEFMSLPTKRSRGRRPPSSPELLFPSNPEVDPNEALIAYSGVTKTGKPRKIFLCKVPDCNKIFKRSEHLKRHVRSIHTEIKPFQCQWPSCGKLFSRHDNLNQHLRVHRSPGQSDASFSAQLEQFFSRREGDRSPSPVDQDDQSPVHAEDHHANTQQGPSVLNLPPIQHHHPQQQQQQQQQMQHQHPHDLFSAQQGHAQYHPGPHHGYGSPGRPESEQDFDENGAPIPRGARESTPGSPLTDQGSEYSPSR